MAEILSHAELQQMRASCKLAADTLTMVSEHIRPGITTAARTTITPQEILRLQYQVDEAYRNNPSAAYMAHSDMAAYFMSLTDGDN